MSLNGARLRYVDENDKEVLVSAKGRTFQIGSYFSCDLFLETQTERLICEIRCDAFGRVTIHNLSNKETPIYLNDKVISGQHGNPLLHGNRITILDRVYTWESQKMSGSEDVPCTPERLSPVEQASNSCPLAKSQRPEIDKRLTVHNFRYSINSDDEGNTSIESRDQSESHLDEEESLNLSAPPSTELAACETPKVDLVEATQNKENTATPPASHRQLLQRCSLSDVVITSFSPRETGVKVEKSFTCVRKPTKLGRQAATASVTMSTPKSVYSTPKGGVLTELNDDSCSRDLMDFSTPSTSKKIRESSMYLIDLTTPSKLRPSFKQLPTPISVDSTDESSVGSPFVIDITKSVTPPTPSRSHLVKTPRRPAGAATATPTRTPQSLMKRALLTSTKKKQIAGNQKDRTPVSAQSTPSLTEARRLSKTLPRLPFHAFPTAEQITAQRIAARKMGQAPNSTPRRRQSLHLGTPRDNKLSQIRKSLAAAKRSPTVDLGNRLKAKARRTLNSPKSASPKSASPKPASPAMSKTINMSQPKCSTPEKLYDSSKDELSRTFTIMNESGEPAEEGSVLGIVAALVTGEMDGSGAAKILETSLPGTEIKESPLAEDQPAKNQETELQSPVEEVTSPSQDDSKLGENGTKSFEESGRKPDQLEDQKTTECSSTEETNENVDGGNIIIEDSICEEVHANIPKPLDEDVKVIDMCEEESPDIKSSDSAAEAPEENKDSTSAVETPQIRRSLRRLSVDQKAVVATTPRRRSSTHRGSVEPSSQAEAKMEGSKRVTRRASCPGLVSDQEVTGTPRRKRRCSEQMSTPTRQSKRLMVNTPKRTVVDDSIGDMGVIVEEDDDEQPGIVEDENYGKELPRDEADNVDYQGLRDLLKTPKNCSTPRFKGLREMMRTPKVPASPIFGNIKELLDNSNAGSTPHHSKASRSITVSRVAVENGKALDGVLKTPSARNIMVPIEPASAVLKSRGHSLATTTEYDLDMSNTTLHLDQIFDDVPSTSVANLEDTEAEINVTALSTASGLDPLKESVSSEAPISISKSAATAVGCHKKDPLTSTTYKTAMQVDLELSTTFTEDGEALSRRSSLGSNEMSGIQLLDQTTDSMFSEALMVSGAESCDVTVEETKAMGQTTCQPLEINEVDTDSNVGLTEPLVLSDDDDDEAEAVEDSAETPKKTTAPTELSVAYKLEESCVSKVITPNQSKAKVIPGERSVNETSVADETKNGKNDSLIEEVSLIDVDESVVDDSINASKDGKSFVIDLDTSGVMDAEPGKENDESAAVELTIVESETFPLDTTEDDSAIVEEPPSEDQKPDESGSPIPENAEMVTEIATAPSKPQIEELLPTEEEVLEESKPIDVALTDEGKQNDASTAVDSEILPLDSTADSSVIVEGELSTYADQKPIDSESIITEEESPEEDEAVIDASSSKELAEEKTGDDGKENDAAVEPKICHLDSTADSSAIPINPEVELSNNADQEPIDSETSITEEGVTGKTTAQEIIEDSPSKEAPTDAKTPDASTEDATAESLGQDVEPNPMDSISIISNPAEVSHLDDTKSEKGDVENDNTALEPLDDEHNQNESISTEIKPEAGEVSVPNEPKSDPEPQTSEVSLVDAEKVEKDDIEIDAAAEKSKAEPEQSTLKVSFVNDKEIPKGDVEEVATCATASEKPKSNVVEIMSPKGNETSSLQDAVPIDPAQEVPQQSSIIMLEENNVKDVAIETEEKNPCDDQPSNGDEAETLAEENSKQNEANKTQMESVCKAKSDKEETTFDQLQIDESAPVPVDVPEESKAADITAGDQQERDVSALEHLAVTEIIEDETDVNNKDVIPDDSTALETTQDESSGQVLASPKFVPPSEDKADAEILLESCQPESAPNQIESEDTVIQLDDSSIVLDTGKDSVVEETPKAKSIANDPEIVDVNEEISAQKEAKPTALLKQSNEVDVIPTDTSSKKSLEEETDQIIPTVAAEVYSTHKSESAQEDSIMEQPGEVTTDKICQDEPITVILESSASSPTAQNKSVAEIPEISATVAHNSSRAVYDDVSDIDGAQEAPVTDKPLIKEDATAASKNQADTLPDHESSCDKEITTQDESLSTTKSEHKDQTQTKVQQSEETVQVNSLASTTAKVVDFDDLESDTGAKSLSETDHLSIEKEAKGTPKNMSITGDEIMSVELTDESSDHACESKEGSQSQVHDHMDAKSPTQKALHSAPIEEVSDVIELSDDSNSKSPPVEGTPVAEDRNTSTCPASEVNAFVAIDESLTTEQPKEEKIENVPEEDTPDTEEASGSKPESQLQPNDHIDVKSPTQKARKSATVEEVSDVINLSDDSNSESPAVEGTLVQEDRKASPDPASKADDSVPIAESLTTEDPKEKAVEEGTPVAEVSDSESPPVKGTPVEEASNTSTGPTSEADASVPIIETPTHQEPKEATVEDVPEDVQKDEAEKKKKLADLEVEAAKPSSVTESIADVEKGEKVQNKSVVDIFAQEIDESVGEVSSRVEPVSDHDHEVVASKKEASTTEKAQNEKPPARINSSLESEMPEKFTETCPEPSVSPKLPTAKASRTARKPHAHADEPSDKAELKPVRRATRKASASVESPAVDILEMPSRRARKPSAEVEEIRDKRRAAHKVSEEVTEPIAHIQEKKEEVMKVIPEEEAHSSRPNEDNEPQMEAVPHQKQEEDAEGKPKRRARKPSEEVKSADIAEKPKRRARKPSAEVPEHTLKKKPTHEEPKEEEQAHLSQINKQNEIQEDENSAQNQHDEGKDELIKNKEIANESNEQSDLQKEGEEPMQSEETKPEIIKSHTDRPKRRGRKASAEETETTSHKKPKIDEVLEVIEEKDTPASKKIELQEESQQAEKPKRRGRKASAEEEANNAVKVTTSEEVLQSIVEEDNNAKALSTVNEESEDVRTQERKRRGRKPSREEVVEVTAASQPIESANGNTENPLATAKEDQPTTITEPNGPKKRTRKSSEFVPAEVHEKDHIERPKRRGRKQSVDLEHVVQDVPDKPRRRGRQPPELEKQPSDEVKEDEPEKKTRRMARKPSAETAEAVAHNSEAEQLGDIEEVIQPEPEPEATSKSPLKEEEKPKTRRVQRKKKDTTAAGHSRGRGRKATEDEAPKSEDPVEAKTNSEEQQPTEVQASSNDEVQELPVDAVAVTATEKKTSRRVRKASANVDEGTAVAKKTTSRRGRKEEAPDDADNVPEKQIDLQQVPTESVPAAVVVAGIPTQIGDGTVTEDDTTPRRREGRNVPRKNYDETSDEDKQRSARRARKPAASKLLAFAKPPEEESTPQSKPQVVEDVDTSTSAVPMPEASTSARREGRNVPRKNYTEVADDDKPSTSRNRRVRNLTAKGLELIVDSAPRSNTPKSRKKAPPEAAPPPTQAESGTEEEAAPVVAKGRTARRKADDSITDAGARGQHEEPEQQPEAKTAKKNVRGTARKAKVETDPDAPVPAKKARGGARAKTPVKPPEEKSATEEDEHPPPTKKARGGARAKTPVKPPEEKSATEEEEHPPPTKKARSRARAKTPVPVVPEDTATEPEDEPAKKPAARSRARVAKPVAKPAVAVPEVEQPTQDSDAEQASPSTPASSGGKARKVHFEATQTAAAAAPSAEDAPKRATRSRRK